MQVSCELVAYTSRVSSVRGNPAENHEPRDLCTRLLCTFRMYILDGFTQQAARPYEEQRDPITRNRSLKQRAKKLEKISMVEDELFGFFVGN